MMQKSHPSLSGWNKSPEARARWQIAKIKAMPECIRKYMTILFLCGMNSMFFWYSSSFLLSFSIYRNYSMVIMYSKCYIFVCFLYIIFFFLAWRLLFTVIFPFLCIIFVFLTSGIYLCKNNTNLQINRMHFSWYFIKYSEQMTGQVILHLL